MKKQVVVIHGADNFKTYEEYLAFLKSFEIDSLDYFLKKGWKSTLQERLGEEYQVIQPQMPNKFNCRYEEWKIWFEKLLPLLNKEIILIGHSMGGIFLAKYLSENRIEQKIKAIFFVAAVYEDQVDFMLPSSLNLLAEQAEQIILYHSKDDKQVPFADLEKYKKALPKAEVKIFEDRGHFNQAEFPELVADIASV